MEVYASTAAHKKIQKELEKCNYLFDETENQKIIMIVLKLEDNPGTVTPILEILKKYKVNISYISSQENGTEYQYFKMGLLIENTKKIKNLIEEISKSCEISILDYEVTDRLLDGTVFYVSFANEMRKILNLNQNQTNEVLVTANTLMQLLDEQKKSPQKTFDYIRRFAKFVVDKKGENFKCNISSYDFDLPSVENPPKIYVLEPPCGSIMRFQSWKSAFLLKMAKLKIAHFLQNLIKNFLILGELFLLEIMIFSFLKGRAAT